MNTILTPTAPAVKTITLDSETYAEIDSRYGIVTIHRGQFNGEDVEWGGQCIGSLPIEFLLTIAQALPMPAELAERVQRLVLAEVQTVLAVHPACGA